MGAFVLVLILTAYWTLVGQAVLTLLWVRRHSLQRLLLAPAVGIATTGLLVFVLNRAGLPIASFGPALALGLGGFAAATLVLTRPKVPWGQYRPFAGVLLLALFLTGRPLLEFGFDWVSYCNDDMGNYSLAAQRFLHQGFWDSPTEDLAAGKDYSQHYYWYHTNSIARPGNELMLAWAASVTGLSLLQIFMPLILSFHAALISAAGALVCRTRSARTAALVTCALLAFSAIVTYASLYQLIAQVSGIGLLCTVLTVLTTLPRHVRLLGLLRLGLLSGGLVTALLLFYSEALPFFVASTGVYFVISAWYRKARFRTAIPVGVLSLGIALGYFNTTLPKLWWYIDYQLGGAGFKGRDGYRDTFPFYLMPSGAANVFGVLRLSHFPAEPWLSLCVALGGVLLLVAAAATLWMTWKRQPVAVVAFVMFGVAALLLWREEGFGLYKLAMFCQPFLLGAIALAWIRLVGKSPVLIVPVFLLALVSYSSQNGYVEASRGSTHLFNELSGASRSGLGREYREMIQRTQPSRLLLQTDSMVLAKLEALESRGTPAFYLSEQFFDGPWHKLPENPPPRTVVDDGQVYHEFDMHDPADPTALNRIAHCGPDDVLDRDLFVTASAGRTVFNRRQTRLTDGKVFSYGPLRDLQNHLVYVSSGLGHPYYHKSMDLTKVAFWQVEPQPQLAGSRMIAIGKYVGFKVLGPTPTVRVLLDMTVSYKGDGEIVLPPAKVIGEGRSAVGFVGRGAGRVISEPLRPQQINGQWYLVLDCDQEPFCFSHARTGLMKLAGANLKLDRRHLCGWVRELSLLSEEEYRSLAPPSQIKVTAKELLHPDVEFSGVTEDGWVSNESFFCLTQNTNHAVVFVRGMIPQIPDKPPLQTTLTVLVDGEEVGRVVNPKLGDFEYRFDLPVKVPAAQGRRRIELKFTETQRLPMPDNRPMAARLMAVGFDEATPRP